MSIKKRIPLGKRKFANYTRGEEVFNMVSHIVCAACAVAILVLCVVKAASHHNSWGVVSGTLYGSFVIIMATVSSIYHGLPKNTGKQVMRIIDHCDIYFVIAGSYTPILLCSVRPEHPALAWIIFGVEWGAVALATTLTAIDLKKYQVFSFICYLVMGWGIVFCLNPVIKAMTMKGFMWILLGGVSYTIGAFLYLLGKKEKYAHGVFHIFVVIGIILQFFGIYGYVM